MVRLAILTIVWVGVWAAGGSAQQNDPNEAPGKENRTLLDKIKAFQDKYSPTKYIEEKWLNPNGIELETGATYIYQANTQGGLRTSEHSDRIARSSDWVFIADMERVAGLPGEVYMLIETSANVGLDPDSVGSFFNVNGDALGDHCLEISEFWYEFPLFPETFSLRLGKIDLTNPMVFEDSPASFDSSLFANDETTQFLNGALVNNPTIPFPDYSLGLMALLRPGESWYVSLGAADAEPRHGQVGFNTAFNHGANYFYIAEAGASLSVPSGRGPLAGLAYAGIWYDPQEKDKLYNDQTKRDDRGFYLGYDQMLWHESAEVQDGQGLGLFSRYGWADDEVNVINHFWSLGVQYQGFFPGRDMDVMAVGFAEGLFSDRITLSGNHESVYEWYYNLYVTDWMAISPDVQYVVNPGGNPAARDAIVVGLRARLSF